MKVPVYKNRSIGSIISLARAIHVNPKTLIRLATTADKYYHPNKPEPKSDGGIRQTYSVLSPLSELQDRIKTNIFYQVDYPDYLQGGIRDLDNPRDYVKDADYHAGRKILIKEDISNFFPSISRSLVMKMWQHFFKFPAEVAQILTDLTIYSGYVPQGASTSSYIANLVFWDIEPALEFDLRRQGYFYSRLVDDITVSTNIILNDADAGRIVSRIYAMFLKAKAKPNRKKHKLMRLRRKTIHNLNIDSGRPTISKKERSKIRAAVKDCERGAEKGRQGAAYKTLFDRTRGRVAVMARLHPNEARPYIERLNLIKPE